MAQRGSPRGRYSFSCISRRSDLVGDTQGLDLVEEECPSFGLVHQARCTWPGSGEGSRDMAEQLVLE
jgi:hypothetical protein